MIQLFEMMAAGVLTKLLISEYLYEHTKWPIELKFDENYEQVLRLARGGAARFALSEYRRLELDKIRHNEDVMALHGRLFKDLFLSQSGKESQESARISAEKYEAAFKDTQGFYSGINAATMSLVSGILEENVQVRAKRILDLLPPTESLTREEKYFVEATRSEAYLLMGDEKSAQKSLQTALDHDPLNFTAHASTLKQFHMIGTYNNQNYDWLMKFRPPKAVHFAGHMFCIQGAGDSNLPCLMQEQVNRLRVNITNLIQSEDIGFGYGALAAGADIMIAEAILEQGGEIHIVLPTEKSTFLEYSVKPYGDDWVRRFENCLSNASSFYVISANSQLQTYMLEKEASLFSMSRAIRRADSLSVPCAQFLIWDEETGNAGTASDAESWGSTERTRYIIPYEGDRKKETSLTRTAASPPKFNLITDVSSSEMSFELLPSAISMALEHRNGLDINIRQGLFCASDEDAAFHEQFMELALPGSVLLSERVANYIAIYHFEEYSADFLAVMNNGNNVFVLREKGKRIT